MLISFQDTKDNDVCGKMSIKDDENIHLTLIRNVTGNGQRLYHSMRNIYEVRY